MNSVEITPADFVILCLEQELQSVCYCPLHFQCLVNRTLDWNPGAIDDESALDCSQVKALKGNGVDTLE